MVNSEQFAARLQKIMQYYEVSAAGFAEAIEVGRSSISHILSGRNKPSLDFVLKVVQTYPEVELYWLLNGKGSFPLSAGKEGKEAGTISENRANVNAAPSPVASHMKVEDLPPVARYTAGKKIIKIVVLFEDGTFEAFENGNHV